MVTVNRLCVRDIVMAVDWKTDSDSTNRRDLACIFPCLSPQYVSDALAQHEGIGECKFDMTVFEKTRRLAMPRWVEVKNIHWQDEVRIEPEPPLRSLNSSVNSKPPPLKLRKSKLSCWNTYHMTWRLANTAKFGTLALLVNRESISSSVIREVQQHSMLN